MAFNDNWDGIRRNNQQPLNEELEMKHFTDMADFSREIMAHAKDMKGTGKKDISGFTPAQRSLYQIANSLVLASYEQQNFLKGLLYHLEGIHKKTMSPSKHGNMEIMRDLETVIRELKKYKK
jgi:hypothetical protein